MKAFVAVALACVAVVAAIEDEGYAFDVKHDFYGGGIGGGQYSSLVKVIIL